MESLCAPSVHNHSLSGLLQESHQLSWSSLCSFHHLFFHKTTKVVLINLKLAHVTLLIRAFQGLPISPSRATVLIMPSEVMSGLLFPGTCVRLLFLDSSVSATLVFPGSSNTSSTASSQGDVLAFHSEILFFSISTSPLSFLQVSAQLSPY